MSQAVYTLSDSDSDAGTNKQHLSAFAHRNRSQSLSPCSSGFLIHGGTALMQSSPNFDRYLIDDYDIVFDELNGIAPSTPKSSPRKKPVITGKDRSRKMEAKLHKLDVRQQKIELKLKMKEDKKRLLEVKQQERAEKKKQSELLKQLKPGECIKFIVAIIDTNLVNQKFGGELLNALRDNAIQYSVQDQNIANTINWRRNIDQQYAVDDHIIIVFHAEELIALISNNSFLLKIDELLEKYPIHRCTLVIHELDTYFRMKRTKKNVPKSNDVCENRSSSKLTANFSRHDVEVCVTELQLLKNICVEFTELGEQLALFVVQFSKAVAELPFKSQRNKNYETLDWFAPESNKDCISVDSNCNGLSQLWVQQLKQFPKVCLDVAQAIAAEYRSPLILMEAYDQCSSNKEKELLLQNIQIRRSYGPLNSTRRVGPDISRKVFHFFSTTDGNISLLGNKTI